MRICKYLQSHHTALFPLNCTQLSVTLPTGYSHSLKQLNQVTVKHIETHNIRVNFKLDTKHWTTAVDAAKALNFLCSCFKQFLWTDVKAENITITLQTFVNANATSQQQHIIAESGIALLSCKVMR